MSQQSRFEAGQEIANKGEVLRDLLLMEGLLGEIQKSQLVVDGVDVSKYLEEARKSISGLIPLVKQELPEWAQEIAMKSFDSRSGFVIWEENFTL